MNWYWKHCKICWSEIWKNTRSYLCQKHYNQKYQWSQDQKLKSLPKVPVDFEFLSEKERICIINKYLWKTYREIWEIFNPQISKQAVEQIIKQAEKRYYCHLFK